MKTIYEPAYRQLVAKLRQKRRELQITQTEAARQLGVSRNWISKVELCELRLDLIQLVRLAGVYHISVTALLSGITDPGTDGAPHHNSAV
jgi:transcriptional regulator with XRE-family HTH domain